MKPWRWSRWWSRESQCQISESSSTPPLFNSFSDLVLISDNYNYLIIVLINNFTGTGFSIPLCQPLTNHMLLKLSRESQFQIWDNWWLVDSFIKTCFSIYPLPNINQIILFINGHHKFYSVLLTVVIIFCVLYFYWYFTEVLLNFYCTFAELLLNLYWTFTYLCWTFSELNTHSCYCLLCVELVPQRSHQHHLKIRCDLSSEVQKKEGKESKKFRRKKEKYTM